MKTIASLLTSLVIAFWVVVIAIIAMKNGEPVSLRFLSYQSIQIPFGFILALSVGIGIISTTILKTLGNIVGSGENNSQLDEEPEFFSEDDF
ncbi:DUF1049 domain-containing protein [Calothrix sp. UHCC 0171]|uniref:DUF1049 domain-containing protein n=1 Tax=Calothrix sp. UHCC 0171 TaxID=3110245 RepID=UPI002B1E9B45|nr:DUF1049 domain-containing protein [Calothrix sp. UHCC 0171]MEA5572203.1 DUF1049 domain-containing protein [Calothrix sp. UHCC 0171]